MKTNLVFLSYGDISKIIHNIKSEYQQDPNISIKIQDTLNPVEIALDLQHEKKDCIIISSGINARNLQADERVTFPIVAIKPTVFDILIAVKTASEKTRNIAVIALKEYIPDFNRIISLLNIVPQVIAISEYNELPDIMDRLKSQENMTVIGSSIVCSYAKNVGLQSVSIWSETSVRIAIENALEISNANKQILINNRMLETILNQSNKGVIYIDNDDIIRVFNKASLNAFKVSDKEVIGRKLTELFPDLPIEQALSTDELEVEHVIDLNGEAVLLSCIPFEGNNKTPIGTMISLQYAKKIQESEERYRRKLHKKEFVATITFDDILGKSAKIREVKNIAINYAHTNSVVLIAGETGTGKELFAQSIHNESPRSDKSFVAANCAAIPSTLIESELFGYEEGAFTGAKKDGKLGLFELAHGGTLFLDEIGEISLTMQSRLLRVLEQKEVLRVGSESLRYVDVRVIAATNKDLWELVQKDLFRKDLYYRLNVLELFIPPLRFRLEDIPALSSKFLSELRKDISPKEILSIANSPVLRTYDWPGNIRQLRNIMERFSAMYERHSDYGDLFSQILFPRSVIRGNEPAKTETSLESLLQKHNGNRVVVAKELGISRTTLWRRMKEEGLSD